MEKLFLLLTIFIIVSKGIYSKETENRKILSQLCPKGFLRLGHSCYYFSADMMTWQEAYFDCLHREGTLTSIESPWEDLLLRTYLNKPQLARLESLDRWRIQLVIKELDLGSIRKANEISWLSP
ncbi:hypothetical protein Anas_06590 [Armadillidium nasatum]|uniref:C-type lectin domain-containing protein n=1 Tax=Armadillidium nasatum TaxID=96803 RepID=A0A5N5T2H9_9CRUS|nr:hypothetical protein Anas_06590 [Armadillidium nasatum]